MKTFWRLLLYIKPYRGKLVAAFMLAAGVTVLGLLPPYMVKIIIDDVIIQKDLRLFTVIIGILFLVYILRSIFISFRIIMDNKVQQGLIFDLRNHVYHCLQRLSLSYFEVRDTGKIVSRIINDVESLQAIVTAGLVTLFVAFITFIGSLVILVTINLKLTFCLLYTSPSPRDRS